MQRDFFSYCKSLRLIELKAVGQLSEVRHFQEGERIYSSGDEGGELFIINRGAAEIILEKASSGAPAAVLSRGDLFGALGALLHVPRDHAVRACAALSVQCFHSKNFPELLRRVPSFFLFLTEKLASRLFQATELARSQHNAFELSGSLGNFDIVTVYQTIRQSQQTGLLMVTNESSGTNAEFYFDKGTPRWGRFDHLVGEEAFWQLFLHDEPTATFSFSKATDRSEPEAGTALDRPADEMLITAIHQRDQFDDVRRHFRDDSVTLLRKRINLTWDDPELEELRLVAETIWQNIYSRQLSLRAVYEAASFSELKIYRVVQEMVRGGLIGLGVAAPKGMLVAS